MNEGDLLGVLHDSRPKMPLQRQLRFAIQVADGMDYLSTELCVLIRVTCDMFPLFVTIVTSSIVT